MLHMIYTPGAVYSRYLSCSTAHDAAIVLLHQFSTRKSHTELRLPYGQPTTVQSTKPAVGRCRRSSSACSSVSSDERNGSCIAKPEVQATGAGIERAGSRRSYVEDRDKRPRPQQVVLGNCRRASEEDGASKGPTTTRSPAATNSVTATSIRTRAKPTGDCYQVSRHH